MKIKPPVFIVILTGIFFTGYGQSPGKMSREEYINTYKKLAIAEMKRTGIPASITMAQACLESGDGNSRLAKKANNHFGIKCHNDWNGKQIHHDDDARNECFRKYNSVEDSYRDHSDYLLSMSRYDFLFELESTDYKAWARGLKKAGYATSSTYANALITIIEEYRLFLLDNETVTTAGKHKTMPQVTKSASQQREIFEQNRIRYIIAGKGDSFESLTNELGKLPWELPRYNDLPISAHIDSAELIYIQPKRNNAAPGNNTHVVKKGETLYSISQYYGIKLEKLYEKNQLSRGSEPKEGTVLQLRKSLKPGKIPLRPAVGKDMPLNEEEEMIFELDDN